MQKITLVLPNNAKVQYTRDNGKLLTAIYFQLQQEKAFAAFRKEPLEFEFGPAENPVKVKQAQFCTTKCSTIVGDTIKVNLDSQMLTIVLPNKTTLKQSFPNTKTLRDVYLWLLSQKEFDPYYEESLAFCFGSESVLPQEFDKCLVEQVGSQQTLLVTTLGIKTQVTAKGNNFLDPKYLEFHKLKMVHAKGETFIFKGEDYSIMIDIVDKETGWSFVADSRHARPFYVNMQQNKVQYDNPFENGTMNMEMFSMANNITKAACVQQPKVLKADKENVEYQGILGLLQACADLLSILPRV